MFSRLRLVRLLSLCVFVSAFASSLPDGGSLLRGSQPTIAGHRLLQVHEATGSDKKNRPLINYARAMFHDVNNGVYWVGALRLFAYYDARDQWVDLTNKLPGNLSEWVRFISVDRVGRIWLQSGLPSRLGFMEGLSWHPAEELVPPLPLPRETIVFSGSRRELWFVTSGALMGFDGLQWAAPVFPPQDIEQRYDRIPLKNSATDHNRRALSAPFPKGPEKADSKATSKVSDPRLMREISRGLQAADASIWLVARKAIIRFRPDENSWNEILPQGLSNVDLIYEDRKGRIWFADREGHLCVYDAKLDRWKSFDLKRYFPRRWPSTITSVYQDRSGEMMIGTADAGLITFDEKLNKWNIFDEENADPPLRGVFGIVEDRKERIWVGTGSAILVLAQK